MKSFMRLCAVLCAMQLSSVAIAQDTNWTNAGGDAEWTNSANWSSGAVVGGTNFLTTAALPAAKVTTPGVGAARVVTDTGGAIDIQAGGDLSVLGQILMGNGPGSSSINVDGTLTAMADVVAVGTNPGGTGNLTVGPTGTFNANGPWLIAGFGGAGAIGNIDVNGGAINVGSGFMTAGWAGSGSVTVNNGGQINVLANVFQIGPSGGDGTVVINDGTISAVGLNNTNGSLLIEANGTYDNAGGYVAGGTVTINDTGRILFDAAVSPLADVMQLVLVDDAANWNFNIGPSITESGGIVTVTNVPEPASLLLLGLGVCLSVCCRQQRA